MRRKYYKKGNDIFKQGDFLAAASLYEKSLFHSDFDQAQVRHSSQLVNLLVNVGS